MNVARAAKVAGMALEEFIELLGALVTLALSPLAGAVLHALNYSRLGWPQRRRLALFSNPITPLVFIFFGMVTSGSAGSAAAARARPADRARSWVRGGDGALRERLWPLDGRVLVACSPTTTCSPGGCGRGSF